MRSLRPYALRGSMARVTLSRSLKGKSSRRWQGLPSYKLQVMRNPKVLRSGAGRCRA